MWKTLAASASSKERFEGWHCFTVPRFAPLRHFHGSAFLLGDQLNNSNITPLHVKIYIRLAALHSDCDTRNGNEIGRYKLEKPKL